MDAIKTTKRNKNEIINDIMLAISELAAAMVNTGVLPIIREVKRKYHLKEYPVKIKDIEEVVNNNMDKGIIRAIATRSYQSRYHKSHTNHKVRTDKIDEPQSPSSFDNIKDGELVAELRGRGYTVTATKTVEVAL